MIIFFYGADTYRLKQAKLNIVGEYRNKYPGGFNLISIDLAVEGLDKLNDIIRNSSIFSEHRLVIAKGVFNSQPIADRLSEIIKENSLFTAPDITLFLTEYSPEKDINLKGKDLFKNLLKGGKIVKAFDSLKDSEKIKWAEKEIESRGCTIAQNALLRLVDASGDSWALVNEIDKLTAYKNKGHINLTDVEALVVKEFETNIFHLTDAISAGNRLKSMELLYKEVAKGSDPYFLLSLAIGQFRNLLIAKDLLERGCSKSEISSKSGIHPFVVSKILALLPKYSMADLKLKFSYLSEIDIKSKRGSADIKDLLYRFILA